MSENRKESPEDRGQGSMQNQMGMGGAKGRMRYENKPKRT